ncbi:MAG: DUF6029 family protein [Crocinitomicaceae bacterium]|nr:DUF6029 family protein [Crocinitomicaceae bacterium]
MKISLCIAAAAVSLVGYSQNQNNGASITGNIESTFQFLNNDTLIGANQPAEKGLLNTYMNVFYTQGNFKAGMRVESYLPRIQGYPNRFDGTGIGMRYIGYSNDFVDVTLGSFYEQFGSGMIFRAYEDRALGYDNLMDGARLILRPYDGVTVKGVYGYQRLSFQEGRIVHSDGIVRGFDAEMNLNTTFKKLKDKKLDITVGGSFMSKYQKDDREDLILPENVGSYGGRAELRYGKFTLDGEYIIKEQDPSIDNNFIYNYGHAALFNFGYSRKGLGIILAAKSVDNMSYRSDRNKELQDLFINFLPAMNKTHTYNLVASLYPYATQPVGETAFQGEVLYTIKKGSKLGGKYGTSINANFSTAYRPNQRTEGVNPLDSTGVTYSSGLFDMSDSLYWRDFNINIERKFTKKFKLKVSYFNIVLNNDVAKVTGGATGNIYTNIGVIEGQYKINRKHSVRWELQALFIKDKENGDINDQGNWATAIIEYNVSPHWFFSVMDQYNYGNPNPELRVHYFYGTFGYIRGATRISAGYGRQRAGLFCVGGVCRFVPASNGLTLSFTQSF